LVVAFALLFFAEGAALPKRPQEIPIGSGELLAEGERVALLGYGYGVQVALGEQLTDANRDLLRPLRQRHALGGATRIAQRDRSIVDQRGAKHVHQHRLVAGRH